MKVGLEFKEDMKDINEIFKRNLELKYNLILHPPMGGYGINIR